MIQTRSEDGWKAKWEEFQRMLNAQPDNGELWFEYAQFLDHLCNNPRLTLNAYETAQQLLLEQDLRLFVGPALLKANRIEDGLAMIRSHLEEKPSAHGYCILADSLLELNEYQQAREALTAALTIDPEFEEGYYLMGEAVRSESKKQAIPFYREALKRDSQYQLAWRKLGSALIAEKETLQDGLDALRRALALNPKDGWAAVYLANGLWRAGQMDDAEKQYKKALELFPDYDYFRDCFADFLIAQGRAKEAEKLRLS